MKLYGFISCCLFSSISFAQQKKLSDTLFAKKTEQVVVTATRTEKKLSNIAVPVTLISQQQIQQAGALRLNDILQEQTGLLITANSGSGSIGGGIFGNGIQMQGLSPDYTMILLDGEPLVGRQGGVMDLSRFAIGNIKRIEIVKGPSSSLYGSEALAGVINLITEPIATPLLKAGLRYGSFNATDAYISGKAGTDKNSLYFFFNRNSSDGYDLDASTPEKNIDPFYNYTAQLKFTHKFNPNSRIIFNSRYNYSVQRAAYAINNRNINVKGNGTNTDFMLNPVWLHQFNAKIKNRLSAVASGFSFVQKLDSISNGKQYYYDEFAQHFFRVEEQIDFNYGKHHFSAGGGYTLQTVNTIRYKEQKQQQQLHAFIQHEFAPSENFSIISGLRYDYTRGFAARISPKLALHYRINEQLSFNASAGSGFKAPDFRQLYLNFTNSAGDGYSIFGASEFSVDFLQSQQRLSIIANILPAAFQITNLQPEISAGYNAGFKYQLNQKIKTEINFFRNDINGLINFIPVATNANGSSVFSYVNINRAFTQGAEFNFQYQFNQKITIQAGYQFLQTADKDILTKIKQGEVFGRDIENGSARLMQRNDYSGLLNRSKHMANLRFFYADEKSGTNFSMRLIYRSRWGVVDKDGNGFANMAAEFAAPMLQVNIAAGKQINSQWAMQAGVNNILNQINPVFAANMPGIHFFLAINYSIQHKK